jgi:hypothetical protein
MATTPVRTREARLVFLVTGVWDIALSRLVWDIRMETVFIPKITPFLFLFGGIACLILAWQPCHKIVWHVALVGTACGLLARSVGVIVDRSQHIVNGHQSRATAAAIIYAGMAALISWTWLRFLFPVVQYRRAVRRARSTT